MKILLTATVQSHIVQFHKPLVEILRENDPNVEIHAAGNNNLAVKNGLKLDFVDKVFDIPFSRSPKSPDNFKAYKKLKKIVCEEEYDIIHCNTPMGGIVTRLAAKEARKNGTKVFYTAHGFHFYKGAPKKNWLIFYPIEKYFSRLTDNIITITNEDYDLASKKFHCNVSYTHGVGVNLQRYHSHSDEEHIAAKEKLGFTQDNDIILRIGELLENKNHKMSILAMKEIVKSFPNAKMVVAGNGPMENELRNFVINEGLENSIKFIGYVTNLEEYQAAADILLACSYREGLPLNLVESMLSRTVVVASKNRGHNQLIKNGEWGYLVDSDDYQSMAIKTIELLKDKKKYQQFADNAENFAMQYTNENVKKELKQIYFGK